MSSLLALVVFVSASAPDGTPQEKYVERYAAIAVSEMYRTGVPASITLAQGLLESRHGLSPLAAEGNNHFGIKCHDWTGKKQYADDDRKGECFRVYGSAEESFRDHSDFLRYRNRYKSLFEYKVTDYKSWAYGLKEAGYATDPSYPAKLIKLIEDYDLARYDRMSVKQAQSISGQPSTKSRKVAKPSSDISDDAVDVGNETAKGSEMKKESRKEERKEARKEEKKSRKVKKNEAISGSDLVDESQTVIPESPLTMETPQRVAAKVSETYRFSLSRQMYSLNGVPFIYAAEGETIASIASSNNLFVKELLKFNDMKPGQGIEMGDVIYLQAKKKQTAKGLDKYIADQDGESLWQISQRYGVKLDELCKRNSLARDYILREGDTILLR